jgi:hypothetical protein
VAIAAVILVIEVQEIVGLVTARRWVIAVRQIAPVRAIAAPATGGLRPAIDRRRAETGRRATTHSITFSPARWRMCNPTAGRQVSAAGAVLKSIVAAADAPRCIVAAVVAAARVPQRPEEAVAAEDVRQRAGEAAVAAVDDDDDGHAGNDSRSYGAKRDVASHGRRRRTGMRDLFPRPRSAIF